MPYSKTGGLADVVGALLKKMREAGREAYLILPLYRGTKEKFALKDTGLVVTVPLGGRNVSGSIFQDGGYSFFLDCDEFFGRPDLYGTSEGDYPDNPARFIFFDRGVLEACKALDLKPDIIHCNDWQTGLLPLYLKTLYHSDFFAGTASLMTLHNLAYQGLFGATDFPLTGLSAGWFSPEGIEFYGKINFLKAGIIAADVITTVSKTYAQEIMTAAYGCGLEGVLKRRATDLHGVMNGIDTEEWNPRNDRYIAATYSRSDMSGKEDCRRHLMKECGFEAGERNVPLLSFIGRLSDQKGLDILTESLDEIISAGANLIILGKGDDRIQKQVLETAAAHKGRMFVRIGYEEAFAHRIYAGSDMFLMPSKYEPCGLGQLIAMRYGTIPLVRRTGGLADTVNDYDALKGSGTGFLFGDYTASSLSECIKRALCTFADRRRWKKMIRNAMDQDFSWVTSAMEYARLYETAVRGKRG